MTNSRLNRRAGVTLIEILIAVTLLSLLATGVLIAMRLGFNTMDKTDARLTKNRRVVNARRILESEISGFVYTLANYYPKPDTPIVIPYLEAQPNEMRFVTTYSLNEGWRGLPQLAELRVIPGEKGEGVRLILNEAPYTGPVQAGLRIAGIENNPAGFPIIHYLPIQYGNSTFVLADRLAYCRFSYLENRPEPPFQLWRPDWIQPARLPSGVRIEMAPLDKSPTDLHVTTVSLPLRITRVPGANYAD